MTIDFSLEWTKTIATARPSCTRSGCATRSTRLPNSCSRRQQRRLPLRVRRVAGCLRPGLPRLFGRLDWLTDRLRDQRYLVGDTITEADVRLFTTLARFDAVYHGHFKCNRTS